MGLDPTSILGRQRHLVIAGSRHNITVARKKVNHLLLNLVGAFAIRNAVAGDGISLDAETCVINWPPRPRTMHVLSFLSAIVLSLELGALAQTDFSVTSSGIYAWNQSDWSLTTTRFTPGQYQSRLSLANGQVHFIQRLCYFRTFILSRYPAIVDNLWSWVSLQ